MGIYPAVSLQQDHKHDILHAKHRTSGSLCSISSPGMGTGQKKLLLYILIYYYTLYVTY